MKSLVVLFVAFFTLTPLAAAIGPAPGNVTIDFGCGCVKLHWGAADSADVHPQGYIIYRAAETRYNWTQINQELIQDTTYIDNELVIGDQFNYAVVAQYADGNSGMSIGASKSLYDASQYDFFIIGDESTGDINWWYFQNLEALGLHGIIVGDILPYCGSMLADLPLLCVVSFGDGYNPFSNHPERETALIDYLDRGGRLYSHDSYQTYSDELSQLYLGYEYTTCMPYAFTSIHGMDGTFTEGLRYWFTDTQYSSNLAAYGAPQEEVFDVLEDDVGCGCVDLAVDRNGFKAVINSQPLNEITGHDTTGTVLTYFERMMEFFGILTSVDDTPGNLPGELMLFAYPNPFNANVKIRLVNPNLTEDKTIGIYDVGGRLVRTIPMNRREAEVLWNGVDNSGAPASSGVYFARMTADGHSASARLVLLK